jgi:DNA-binding Xre family transcriptional regulator
MMRLYICASEEGLKKLDQARNKKGWTKSAIIWCNDAETCESTLKRMWRRQNIYLFTFQKICEAVDLNWEDIVDWEKSSTPKAYIFPDTLTNSRSSFPFDDNGCIRDLNRFFDRQIPLSRIYELLNMGNSVSVVGESKIGKSSLLWKLHKEGSTQLNINRNNIIYFDLLGIEKNIESFKAELCLKFRFDLDINSISFRGNFFRKLEKKSYILCLDEMEVLQDLPRDTLDFLRFLAGGCHHPLTLVTASRSPLSVLFPDSIDNPSPLYNICRKVELECFSSEDAKQFIQHRLKDSDVQFTDSQIEELLKKSKCHPARLQEEAAILYRSLTEN